MQLDSPLFWGQSLDEGFARLTAALERCADVPVDDLLDGVLAAVQNGGTGEDDTALVALRLVPLSPARLDIRLQTALAQHLTSGGVVGFLADPAGSLERSDAVSHRLADLRGAPRFHARAGYGGGLPVLGDAPEFTGTHRGEFFGVPPTGKRASIRVMDFVRYQDGKVAEHWNVVDVAGLMQQLGAAG